MDFLIKIRIFDNIEKMRFLKKKSALLGAFGDPSAQRSLGFERQRPTVQDPYIKSGRHAGVSPYTIDACYKRKKHTFVCLS
jgi:hypothetical protein